MIPKCLSKSQNLIHYSITIEFGVKAEDCENFLHRNINLRWALAGIIPGKKRVIGYSPALANFCLQRDVDRCRMDLWLRGIFFLLFMIFISFANIYFRLWKAFENLSLLISALAMALETFERKNIVFIKMLLSWIKLSTVYEYSQG